MPGWLLFRIIFDIIIAFIVIGIIVFVINRKTNKNEPNVSSSSFAYKNEPNSNTYLKDLLEDIEKYRREHDDSYARRIYADEIICSFECMVKMNPKSFDRGMDIIKNEEMLLDPYTGSNYIDYIS